MTTKKEVVAASNLNISCGTGLILLNNHYWLGLKSGNQCSTVEFFFLKIHVRIVATQTKAISFGTYIS